MSALPLDRKIVIDHEGNPSEVLIPYDQFVNFVEAYGLDLSDNDKAEIKKAEADYEAGNRDAFIGHEELKRSLGCTD